MFQIKFMLFSVVALMAIGSAIAIIGGENATRRQFPFYALLRIYRSRPIYSLKSSYKYNDCGGALISNQHVITSAQCLVGSKGADVYLGLVTLNDTKADGLAVVNVTKKDYLIYPTFDKKTPYLNDIALIKLPKSVWFSKSLYIIPLATSPTVPATDVITMGFGRISPNKKDKTIPTTLQYIKLKTVDLQKCLANTQSLISKNSFICANGTLTTSNCKGDLGNPLVAAGKLIGISSFENVDCRVGLSQGFTGISSYTQWIEGAIEGKV